MSSAIKNQKAILSKLGIEKLNPMQEEAQFTIHSSSEVILLSPTGTGKTLAFLLPTIAELDPDCLDVQALIVVPTRELAIQIEQVSREMGTGFKINAVYGGQQTVSRDKMELKHRPAILIGTPGRIADHLRRKSFSTDSIKSIVLDEFDKSLEIGFESEMTDIMTALPNLKKKILTSATIGVMVPRFIGLDRPKVIDYLSEKISQLKLRTIVSPSKDKLETLVDALCHIGNKPGIIFCNYKDAIQRVSSFLNTKEISHGCFYGGLDQKDRERALIKFRNGTHQLLLATDLAARGIDVPEIKFIIHYHLPNREEEFTHRNGRTARMHNEGTAYVIHWVAEELADFIQGIEEEVLQEAPVPQPSSWQTLFISGGRKDKISKGDIAGLFFKQANLSKEQLGVIELKKDCAFVAVQVADVEKLAATLNNTRLKKKKVRIHLI